MNDKLEVKVTFAAVDRFNKTAGRVTEGARQAVKAFKENSDALKQLNKTVETIDAFKQAGVDAAITANKFKATRTQIDELKASIDKAGVPTKQMAEEMARLTRESETLKNKHQSLVTHEQRLHEKLTELKVDTSNLAEERRKAGGAASEAINTSRRLAAALDVESKKVEQLNAARAKMQAFKDRAGKLAGAGAGMMAAGAAVEAPLALTLKHYADLQEATTMLKTSMMDSSGKVEEAFGEVQRQATELGKALPGTTRDFIEAARALKQQGVSSQAVIGGGLQASAYLGVRFKLDQERAAEFIGKAKEAHGLKDSDLPAAADYIHRARESFGLRHDDIYESMKYAATDLNIKKQVGDMQKMKEYLAIQGMAGQQGLEGSTFGTNFSHMMKIMASVDGKLAGAKGKEGVLVRELMEQHKIKFNFYDKGGQFLGFQNMIKELSKLNVLNDQEKDRVLKKLFDTEGSRVAAVLLNQGMAGFTAGLEKMENTASLNMVIAEMAKTLNYQSEAFRGNLETISGQFGAHLEPAAAKQLERLNAVLEWLGSFNKEHPQLAGAIMKTIAAIGFLLVALGGIALVGSAILGPFAMLQFMMTSLGISGITVGGIFGGLFARIAGAVTKVGAALLWVGQLAMAHPVIALISILAAGALYVWANWETIGPKFKALIDGIGGWFGGLKDRAIEIGGQMIDGMIAGIGAKWEALKAAITGIGDASVGWLKEKLGIHSPSRVFAQLGAFTMEGFEQGLQGGENGPLSAVGEMAKKLASIGAGVAIGGAAMAGDIPLDTRPPINPAALMGAMAPMQVTIQIYGAPGQGTDDIQRQVERALANIENQRAARQRSRLRDSE